MLQRIRSSLTEPTSILAAAVLLSVAALVSLPAALGPIRLNDSFWIDLVWLKQFARELGSGIAYPRWLAQSHGGLGSPVFYYYPPLAFYAASVFIFAGLSAYPALIATFFAASLLSGAGVYLWLKDQSRLPLAGAVLFMIAPYHLFNFYQRGAIAESVATALLPFVLWSIKRTIEGRPGGVACTALTYAALIMSHLPLALLASVFLFAPYALVAGRHLPSRLIMIGAALSTGIALSAITLLPALALEQYRSSADMWALPYLQPARWSLWSSEAWSQKSYRAVLLMVATIAIPLVALSARHRSKWALWALACAALAAGAVPLLWSLPALRLVQFPFRLLPIAELAFVTGVCVAPRGRLAWPTLWVPVLAMAGFIITAKPENVALSLNTVQRLYPDVPENLPPGERPFSWPSRWALDLAAAHRRPQLNGTVTVEPLFYFPAWQVRCGDRVVRTFPDPRTRLLSYEGRDCSKTLRWTGPERLGATISLLALLALVSASLWPLRSPASPEQRRSHRRESRPHNT